MTLDNSQERWSCCNKVDLDVIKYTTEPLDATSVKANFICIAYLRAENAHRPLLASSGNSLTSTPWCLLGGLLFLGLLAVVALFNSFF